MDTNTMAEEPIVTAESIYAQPQEIMTDHSNVEADPDTKVEPTEFKVDYTEAMEAARKDPQVKEVEPLPEGGFKVTY